jgi:predicted transport protein
MTQRPSIATLKEEQKNLSDRILLASDLFEFAKDRVKSLSAQIELLEDQYEDVTKLINELEGTKMKQFKRDVTNVKAWACIDEEVGLVGIFDTREAARNNRRYAKSHGHNQVVVRLTFDSVVR